MDSVAKSNKNKGQGELMRGGLDTAASIVATIQNDIVINTAAIKRQFCFLQFIVYVCIVKYFRTVLIPPG